MNIKTPFTSTDYAQLFQVSEPSKNGGHVEYSINGVDENNKPFTIQRRFREFHALRNSLRERFQGMYVPAMP